jgi:hypothetical protein
MLIIEMCSSFGRKQLVIGAAETSAFRLGLLTNIHVVQWSVCLLDGIWLGRFGSYQYIAAVLVNVR